MNSVLRWYVFFERHGEILDTFSTRFSKQFTYDILFFRSKLITHENIGNKTNKTVFLFGYTVHFYFIFLWKSSNVIIPKINFQLQVNTHNNCTNNN